MPTPPTIPPRAAVDKDAIWLPIGVAPRDGTPILIFAPPSEYALYAGSIQAVAYWNREDGWVLLQGTPFPWYAPEPSHFMPLPDPPSIPSLTDL